MKKKIIKICFLLLSIFIVFYNISYATTNEQGVENVLSTKDNIDNICNVLNLIIITIDFVFVIGMYLKDKNDDKKYQKNTYKMYWYKKFILENYLNEIETFFNKCENKVIELSEIDKSGISVQDLHNNVLKEYFLKFNKNQAIIKQKITSILGILDEKISTKITESFIDFQEEYTQLSENVALSDNDNVNIRVQEAIDVIIKRKKEIVSELYLYGEDIIK